MGKRSTTSKDGETRVLFKKSQQTMYTQSRTCSGISQANTRSGIIQIKKNESHHQYYVQGKKVKRDLSTVTDICILRRHYKKKRNKMSTQDGSKSLYSTVNTEIDTIEELQQDSACNSQFTNNEHPDITKMIMDNFKDLLNNWIEKYLLDNKDAKDKKESVLYSLLHKTELDKTNTSSSRSTYILNRERISQEVKNKKVEAASIICQYCQNHNWVRRSNDYCKKSSYHSTPASHKNIKVISTLSIPKNLHKRNRKEEKSNYKNQKCKRNVVLPINKPSKIFDCSSFDLLSISTKSFTKRCATYDCDGKQKKKKKKRHIVFLPKPFYKSATDSTTDENKRNTKASEKTNLETMPSLMKSIYADDPANITSTDDNMRLFRNDNYTMTDTKDSFMEIITNNTNNAKSKEIVDEYESEFLQESTLNEEDVSDPMMAIDFINESLVFARVLQPKPEIGVTKTQSTTMDQSNFENHKQTKSKPKNNKRLPKFHKKNKRLIRIMNNKHSQRKNLNFLSHCQNIFQYFSELESKTNMKLDIHVTVQPVNNLESKGTLMSKHDLSNYEKSETIIYNVETTPLEKTVLPVIKSDLESVNNIIPLLDGAENQSKYILKSESCSKTSRDNNTLTTERSTITDAEIIDDISELKSIIKELTKAAEAIVKDHVQKETKPSQCSKFIISKMENISKEIKFSQEIAKHPLLSSIKLSKKTKKTDDNELYTRLMRKSTSYNIIDSESILRVTDMTSAANEINKISKSAKSLPNSKSMVEVTNALHKKKLLTYFYDEYDKNGLIYNSCTPQKIWLRLNNKKCPEPVCVVCDSGDVMRHTGSDCNVCKSSAMLCTDEEDDVEKCSPDSERCRRPGMGFGEGCFYCMLMWIPVIIIASLFYSYVIKEAIYPPHAVLGLRQGNSPPNESLAMSYDIKLSDLGF